jgi:small-conductance mechanosensitive channel
LYYLPNVIIAAIILLIAAVIGRFMQKLVRASADAAGLGSSNTIAGIVKWAIWIFGFVIALTQLGIASTLIQTIVIGIIAMVALAGGLAFGLGGKDVAVEILDKIRQDLGEK